MNMIARKAGIKERTGVVPADYVTYAALRGDPSDNLPGVPGVGEKTAAKLVNAYGDLDGIFAHVDEQTPKLRQNLAYTYALAGNWRAAQVMAAEDVPADQQQFKALNAELAKIWKPIIERKPALPDAEEWKGVKSKLQYLKE